MNKSIVNPIVGVWAPVSGNPNETIEYRADGTVRMAMFGGLLHMEGDYRFVQPDVVEIDWRSSPSADAEAVIGAVNKTLGEEGVTAQVRIVRKSVLQVTVTDNELKTLHVEKGRTGHFRRLP
jgi:hypothetical protein